MRVLFALALFAFFHDGALAQEARDTTPAAEADSEIPEPAVFESEGTLGLDGTDIEYVARAEETYLRDEAGEPAAAIFSISYIGKGHDDPTSRPVTFVWNGGPGSSSVWLHMGAFGPKRVITPSDASDVGAPPYPVRDNSHSLLDVTDLVFIDPVGTGYSRALGDTEASEYYGLREDAESIAEFIRIWLTENGRWNSPKFLAGESYGGTRAAQITETLQGGWNGVALNGVILISPALDFQTIRFTRGNDLAPVAFFPSFAATAWYHDRVGRDGWDGDFDAFLEEARRFAMDSYMPALLRGTNLPAGEQRRLAGEMSEFVGLSPEYLLDQDLRMDTSFFKELLRDEDLSIGRFDGRYTGEDDFTIGTYHDNDPSGYGMDAAYTAAVNDHLTRTLGVEFDRKYKILSGEPGQDWKWSYGRGSTAFPNPTPHLAKGLRENADMRVLVASGYYDLATPFFASELSLYRNGVDLEQVDFTYYDAGHMMYLAEEEAGNLSEDVRKFIQGD